MAARTTNLLTDFMVKIRGIHSFATELRQNPNDFRRYPRITPP